MEKSLAKIVELPKNQKFTSNIQIVSSSSHEKGNKEIKEKYKMKKNLQKEVKGKKVSKQGFGF